MIYTRVRGTHPFAAALVFVFLFGADAAGAVLLEPPPDAWAAATGDPADELADLSWLAGAWVMEAGPRRVEEFWTPARGATMFGVSRTFRDGQLREFEFIRIAKTDKGVAYIAAPGGRFPPTQFPLTTKEARRLVFENPQHDFPTRIEYALQDDGSLNVAVSGPADSGERPLQFKFRRP